MAEQVQKSKVKIVVDKEQFEECLQSAGDKLVVVDFYADWCGPCKMISPEIEKMAVEMEDTVVFLKVNVDDCDDIAMEQGIEAMPTFSFFKQGNKVHVFVGANIAKLREDVLKNVNEQVKS